MRNRVKRHPSTQRSAAQRHGQISRSNERLIIPSQEKGGGREKMRPSSFRSAEIIDFILVIFRSRVTSAMIIDNHDDNDNYEEECNPLLASRAVVLVFFLSFFVFSIDPERVLPRTSSHGRVH